MKAKELVDLLYPEHDRTSCSDGDVDNGFSFVMDNWRIITEKLDRSYHPRCRRCALLEIISGEVKLTEENKEIIQSYF